MAAQWSLSVALSGVAVQANVGVAASGASRAHEPRGSREELAFRLAPFCTSYSMWLALAPSILLRTADFQALPSSARLSHVLMLIFASLMSRCSRGWDDASSGIIGGPATADGAVSAEQRWRVTLLIRVVQCWEYIPASRCRGCAEGSGGESCSAASPEQRRWYMPCSTTAGC